MSESLLKKEFKEADLQRVRNLITKKYGDKTITQVGYTKEEIERKEGDIWEENNKKWTIQNGIKMNIGKFDSIKRLFQFPLLCPECNNPMLNKFDKKFYLYHKKCFNCVIEMEQQLRIKGEWKEYEDKYIKESGIQMLNELEKEIKDFVDNNESFITEQGDIENWNSNNKEKIIKEVQDYIINIKSKLNI